ncbi:Golgi-associated kinase 1B isoform X2 [Thalassophryne amazonica]|uniref:Golgi-associated kinase 1B isoform X2 n=1 Tax=Thalassophryne amazonica TaxID=390379 RepID=UPI001471EA90|nr:Golgi-associated kinase 1B isoform X2 [Thalassophryne amazonica]
MGKSLFRWLCFSCRRLNTSFRRCPLSKKSLVIVIVCVVYLFFVVSHVVHWQQLRHIWVVKDNFGRGGGLDTLRIPHSVSVQIGAAAAVPTRSNVVYVTLKSKRHKPTNIRGTVRPKVRRKVRRGKSAFSHSKFGQLEQDAGQITDNFAPKTRRSQTGDAHYKSVVITREFDTNPQADSGISSIRIYSLRTPPWFSAQDVRTMRFLTDTKILRIKEVSHGDSPSFLMFEAETNVSPTSQKHGTSNEVCKGQCGIISSPVDTSEVFAFHLDRVLALNRTSPAVSRKFNFLHDGQPCPVALWDASLFPSGLTAGVSAVSLTWGEYQSSLKERCWLKNVSPKPSSGCSAVHHYEWSKLALFDFLLQIYNRLDQNCCGFKPRKQDACVEQGRHTGCGEQDRIRLANIICRVDETRQLVFTKNKGFFDRNEDNLDFRLLEGIKECLQISRGGAVSAEKQQVEGEAPPVSVHGPDLLG